MLFYILSPYSGPKNQRFARHLETSRVCAQLAREGIPISSPILHWHFTAETWELPGDAEYWEWQNHHLLEASTAGILFQQPGWKESKGILSELEWFQEMKKPVYFLDLEHGHVDGYEKKAFEILIKNLRRDYPHLKASPAYQVALETARQTEH